jgi:hypothetical protein
MHDFALVVASHRYLTGASSTALLPRSTQYSHLAERTKEHDKSKQQKVQKEQRR